MAGFSVSTSRKSVPQYGLHKATGQARVRIDGRDIYLGPYGSDESRIQYGEIIAKHSAGLPLDPFVTKTEADDSGLTVNELVLAFMRHADQHYRKNGQITSEIDCLKSATRPLVKLYGVTPVDQFGPLALKAVRQQMIVAGWVRRTVNKQVGRIRSIFRWGVENELVQPGTLQRLEAVAPLLAGRSAARDNPPRSAVPEESIAAVRAEVSELIRDLIDLQRLCGARSGEMLSLTTAMIDRTGEVWSARLTDHKTAHHGQARVLHFGPKGQLILRKYLSTKQTQPLFAITDDAYRRAITRVCEKLEIPRWTPHYLRHTAATQIRERFGLEHTQAALGHASADMSEHYARLSERKAAEVALAIG